MHKLDYYQNKFYQSVLQGTQEWLKGRSFAFGGSEMGSVFGRNKHETWEDLLHRKAHQSFTKCDATEWGHLFEPVAKLFLTESHGKIYEFGSIPHSYLPVCYSPDGLLVIDDELILLEIKNPIYRGVDKIPEIYIHQVQTGMNVINVKYCLFAQFRFRRCKLGTSPWSVEYDRPYHKEYRKRCKDQGNISYGYLYWETDDDLVDLGSVKSIYDELKIIPLEIQPKLIIAQPFSKEIRKGKVLMWKLFEKKVEKIQPDCNYLKDKEEALWEKYKEMRCFHKSVLDVATVENIEETHINLPQPNDDIIQSIKEQKEIL
jgi:putative phage-type endonuclease